MTLAYLDSLKDLGSHSFLILGDLYGSREEQEFLEIRHALAHLGHSQVDWAEARESEYEELHLSPAYAMASDDKRKTDTLSYQSLVAHADSLRNGVYVDHNLAPNVSRVVHYGFRLIENCLMSTKLRMELVENSHVVPIASISSVWQRLNSIIGSAPSRGLVSKSDLLVCERYWGKSHYQMRDDADPGTYLRLVLRSPESCYERIVFRPTAFYDGTLRWREEIEQYAKSQGLAFTTWSRVFNEGDSATILNHPEAQFFLGRLSDLGGIYAFDGSLAVLIGSLSRDTRVHWPDSAPTDGLFSDERIHHLIVEQSRWMRKVARREGAFDPGKSFGNFYTDGLIYKSLLIEYYLDTIRSELAEKALELDAKTGRMESSLSWKITKPLRRLGKFFLR